MDTNALAGMLFTVVILAMIGGFILLWPISRRLGAILEQRLNERSGATPATGQIQELQATIRELQAELERLAERQDFTEALLQEKEPRRLRGDRELH